MLLRVWPFHIFGLTFGPCKKLIENPWAKCYQISCPDVYNLLDIRQNVNYFSINVQKNDVGKNFCPVHHHETWVFTFVTLVLTGLDHRPGFGGLCSSRSSCKDPGLMSFNTTCKIQMVNTYMKLSNKKLNIMKKYNFHWYQSIKGQVFYDLFGPPPPPPPIQYPQNKW